MTDLEMMKFCAEAMKIPIIETGNKLGIYKMGVYIPGDDYDPLRDDAQAFALDTYITKAGCSIFISELEFVVWRTGADDVYQSFLDSNKLEESLRRVRVEAVAKIQAAK